MGEGNDGDGVGVDGYVPLESSESHARIQGTRTRHSRVSRKHLTPLISLGRLSLTNTQSNRLPCKHGLATLDFPDPLLASCSRRAIVQDGEFLPTHTFFLLIFHRFYMEEQWPYIGVIHKRVGVSYGSYKREITKSEYSPIQI